MPIRIPVLCCALTALVVIACGDDDAMSSPNDNITRAEKVVGPAGATLALSDGAKVEIPAGALLEPTTIVIREVDTPKALPDNLLRAGKTYAFEPHGTLFSEPVKLTLPFDEADGADNEERPIKLDDDDDDTWQTIVGADKTAGKIELETISFSFYVVARPNRASGVITLPDGAIVFPDSGSDASMSDADISDASMPDGSVTDGSSDAAINDDAGDATLAGIFADPDLELEVRRALALEVGPITQPLLDSLTSLATGTSFINSLVGLERCPNLSTLVIPVSGVSDLSPILGLPLTGLTLRGPSTTAPLAQLGAIGTLEAIELSSTNMTGTLDDIAGLSSLSVLTIAGTPTITGGIATLSDLSNLRYVALHQTMLTGDIAAVSDLADLAYLDVSYSPGVTGNLSAFSAMTTLQFLSAESSGISGNVSSLTALSNLYGLVLNDTSVNGNLSSLTGLTQLARLSLANTLVSGALASLSFLGVQQLDLSGLSGVTGTPADINAVVNDLLLSGTSITGTLSSLSTRTNLRDLRLNSTLVSGDVSALTSLTSLMYVDLSSSNVTGDLTSFAPLRALAILRLENAGVTLDFSALEADIDAHVVGEVYAPGAPVDCVMEEPRIDVLRNAGWTITTSCDPIN